MDMIKNIIAVILGFLISLTDLGCSSMKKEISDEQINAEALKAYNDIKSKAKISRNPQATALVQRVAQRIAEASGEKFQWEVILIDSPEMNAWCMPGGKMAVYTGILPVLKNEAALAAVMGHEVAHATRRHGKKAYARAIEENQWGLIIGGASIIGGQLLCKTEECRRLTQIGGAAAGLALTFFNRKFSREDEVDADRVGQIYMAKAGYDPAESIRLWERMAAAKKGMQPPEFISTHPSDENRRNQLSQWLPEANAVYQKASQRYGLGSIIQ